MATITVVKCPSPKRARSGSTQSGAMIAAMRTLKSGEAIKCPVHGTVASSAVGTINAYLGRPAYRAFKAEDEQVYMTVND